MGGHAGVRLITGNLTLTAVNLARPVGNLKKKFHKEKKSRNNGQNLSDKSSEIAELGRINGLNLGRHGILGLELTASAGKEGHAGPGEKSQQNQKQPSCFELLISTQPNHNSKCRATIV